MLRQPSGMTRRQFILRRLDFQERSVWGFLLQPWDSNPSSSTGPSLSLRSSDRPGEFSQEWAARIRSDTDHPGA
jgi:hypothetical protein